MLNDQTTAIRQDQVRLRTREPNPGLQNPSNRSQNKMRTLRKSNRPAKAEEERRPFSRLECCQASLRTTIPIATRTKLIIMKALEKGPIKCVSTTSPHRSLPFISCYYWFYQIAKTEIRIIVAVASFQVGVQRWRIKETSSRSLPIFFG